MKRDLTRIWDPCDVTLCLVAPLAGVQQICVLAGLRRIDTRRHEMFDMECRTANIPLLAMQTVDAPEAEFIAKPLPKASVVLIADRTMFPDVRRFRVLESGHFGVGVDLPSSRKLFVRAHPARVDDEDLLDSGGTPHMPEG